MRSRPAATGPARCPPPGRGRTPPPARPGRRAVGCGRTARALPGRGGRASDGGAGSGAARPRRRHGPRRRRAVGTVAHRRRPTSRVRRSARPGSPPGSCRTPASSIEAARAQPAVVGQPCSLEPHQRVLQREGFHTDRSADRDPGSGAPLVAEVDEEGMDPVAGAVHQQAGAHHRRLRPARDADAGELGGPGVRRAQDELTALRVELGGGAERQVAGGIADLGDQEDPLAVAALQGFHRPREFLRAELLLVRRARNRAQAEDVVVDDGHVQRRVHQDRAGAQRGQPLPVPQQFAGGRQHLRQPRQRVVGPVVAAGSLARCGRTLGSQGVRDAPGLPGAQGVAVGSVRGRRAVRECHAITPCCSRRSAPGPSLPAGHRSKHRLRWCGRSQGKSGSVSGLRAATRSCPARTRRALRVSA